MPQRLPPGWLATLAVAAAALLVPHVVPNTYVIHVLVLATVYGVLATSLNLITGYSGLLSLGHQAFFGLGAYTSALLAMRAGMPAWVGFVAAGAMAAAFGWCIAHVTLRLRSAYFVISTVAMAEIMNLVATNWVDLTQGPMGLTNVPPLALPGLALTTRPQAYYLGLALLAGALAVAWRIVHSDVGRALRAMREHEPLALAVGIDTRRYAIVAFTVSAFLAGVAGSFYAHYQRFLSPDVFLFDGMVTVVVMMLAGGMGTLPGPVIGALLFTAIPEALRFSRQYRLILYALILILLVRFLPQGLWGVVETLRLRLAAAPAPVTVEEGWKVRAEG